MDVKALETKLTKAFDGGFIPGEIKQYMSNNGHEGRVWVVPQEEITQQVEKKGIVREETLQRIGIGYRTEDGSSHVFVHSLDEIERILQEVK